jgi:hypothetical protein
VFADDLMPLRQARGDALVASLPTVAYAIGAIASLRIGVVAGVACAVVVCALAIRRRPMAAVMGLVAVLFAVGIALITRKPSAFFLPAIAINGVFGAGGVLSLLVGRPVVGYSLAALMPRFAGWRTDPEPRRIAAAITALWSAVFILRFVVMGTCYLAGANPSILAVVKVVLGLPLAAVAAAISFRMLATSAEPDPIEEAAA